MPLRRALWPVDADDKVVAMTQSLLRRLRRGTASVRDLRKAANVSLMATMSYSAGR